MKTKPRSGSSNPTKPDFYFDEKAAAHAVQFFERFLVHVKGRWAGQRFLLEEWQREKVIRPLFGWKRADGTRKFRTCYIEIPRKNGKSSLAAGIALYLTYADGEQRAEVYGAAADRDQAAIVFDDAKAMVFASPALLQRGRALKRAIVTNQGSAYKVISADANTKHGYSPHGIIFDELHAQPNRDLYDTLRTGRGARRQPMEVYLTTAGYDRNSICWEVHEYAQRVLKKIVEDESFLAVIFSADETDDWKSPETWTKANPNLGISISEEYLQAECLRAQQSPAYENTFKRLHLNLWTSQSKRFIPMDAWDASSGEIDPIDLEGLPCYAGLDLSCTTDLTALVLVFPVGDEYKILPFFWCPQEGIVERSRRDGVRYDLWAQHGQLTSTEGNVIDYRSILKKLEELRKVYEIREIAYDRWGAPKISQELIEAGFKIIPFGQGFGSMSAPTKELLTLTLAKRMVHGGHPVLRWNMDNMVVRTDPAGNVKPDKEKARQRIDGAVALIMGLDRAQRNAAGGTSVYATRGIRTV